MSGTRRKPRQMGSHIDDIATFGQVQTVRAPVAGDRVPRSRGTSTQIS